MDEPTPIRVVSPADGSPSSHCSYCSRPFTDGDERIQTLDIYGEVTLCRPCYALAGNSVR